MLRTILCLAGVLSLLLPVFFLTNSMPSSDTPQPSSTIQQTQETYTSAPHTTPTTTPPMTESPTVPPDYIGTLYTQEQLLNFNNEMTSFGSGRLYCDKRPTIPEASQKEFGNLNAIFIGEDNPTIYLTFDCGYEYQNLTAKILDVLKEKNVKAVFFVTMYYCQTQPQLVRRMLDEGHIVGNHTANHPYLPDLDIDQVVYEIMSLHDYVKANFDYEMTLLRPPSGCYSPRTLAIAQSIGYQSVFWSFAYQDWETESQPNTEDAFNTVSSCAHNGCIYLLHAVSSANAEILGPLIDDLQQRGYTLGLFH